MKHSVREVTLKNGAKGLLIHVPDAPVMDFDIVFRAGHRYCPEDKIELAHLMEHMVLGANTKYRSSPRFNQELELNGAYSNAYTSSNYVGYVAQCADFEWDRVLDLLVLAIGNPIFPGEEFKSEFGNVEEELVDRSNNHSVALMFAMANKNGTGRYNYQKGKKSLKNITLEDVKKYHKKTHFAGNMRFVIAGNVHSRSKQIIRKLNSLNLEPGGERFTIGKANVSSIGEPVIVKRSSVPNIFFRFETYKDKMMPQAERDALWIMNKVMNEGYTSRILGKARDQGLVYWVDAGRGFGHDHTVWMVGAQVSKKNIEALFDLIVREVRLVLSRGITQNELKHAKQKALGQHQRDLQTVGSLVNGYGGWYFDDDFIDHHDSYPDRIKAVTRTRAQAAFQKVFEEQTWSLGFLGNDIDKELADKLYSKMSTIWQ
ncbi:MAG: pitrilysin family protein [Patescibacteria group bacterium]